MVLSIALCQHCAIAATVTVNDFGDYQVLQRSIGGASATVSLGGTYGGSEVDHILAKVVKFTDGSTVADWQTIASGLSGGTYGGTIVVPQGGWYRIAVSGRNASDAEVCQATGAHRWGVGINVLCIGQSNMVGNGGIRSGYTPITTDLAGLYSNSNAWKKLSDPYDSGGTSSEIDYDSWWGASMIPSFANSLANAFPLIPIGIIPAAKGSSPLHGTADTCWLTRDPANHANPSNLYGNSITNARTVGGVELIIMHQGETDATNNASEAQYRADFDTLIARYRQDLYSSIPLFYCQLGRSFTDTTVKHRTDTTMQRIRNAQHDLDNPANKVYLSALCIDAPVATNDDHYTKPGHDTIGGRLGNAVKFYYGVQNGVPPYYRGPEITSASFADSNKKIIDVTIAHRGGNDFTPSTGITGFQVTNDADTMTPSSAVRQSASTIRLALAKAITGNSTVRYLGGKHPNITGAVHDNTPLQLPLEPTTAAIIVPHINTLSIAIVGNGMVTKAPDRAFYTDGSTVQLTATPAPGYTFTGWSGDASGSTNPLSVTMNGIKNIAANFTIKQFSITLTSTNGTITRNPSQALYDSNTVVQLTATPAIGYTFTGWSGDASGSTNPLSVTMNGNKNIAANFTIKQFSITLTSANGTIARSPNQSAYSYGSTVRLTAVPQTGFHFAGWSGDLTGANYDTSIFITADRNIITTFAIDTCVLSITAVGNGTVTKNPDQPAYPYGSVVLLTAVPQTGYHFTGWSGELSGTTNPCQISMNGAKSVTANFAISAPTTPTPTSPSDGSTGRLLSLSLLWNKTALAQTYHIQVSISRAFVNIFKEDSSLTDTSYSPSGLANNSGYFWHVRAANAGGVSDWSQPWKFITIVAIPAAVIPVAPAKGDTVVTDSVKLLWHKTDSTVLRYWLETSVDSTFTGAKIDSLLVDTATVIKSLINKRTCWWRVRAYNAAGWGTFSEKQYFKVAIPVVNILSKNYQLLLHSMCLRRSGRIIGYSLPRESQVSIRLYDIHGNRILSLVNSRQPPGLHAVSFDRQLLPDGNYILRFKAGSFEVNRKLTIMQ